MTTISSVVLSMGSSPLIGKGRKGCRTMHASNWQLPAIPDRRKKSPGETNKKYSMARTRGARLLAR